MRHVLVAMAIVTVSVGSTACATKKYVNTRVDDVNSKVSTLSTSIEETQERTRKNEQRIGEVDQKADAAGTRAGEAASAAATASSAADRAASAAAAADAKAVAIDQASRRLVFEVILSADNSKFAFGKAQLDDTTKSEIDKVIEQLNSDPKNVFLEIEGHTDAVGSPRINEELGMERAEAVKMYLYEQHNVPLHKMNVISYGETKPVAPNNTRDGRAKNRRVVIKVLT
jgi:outer membrane protein OmpA-like peptidoglycan-associated protein